MLLRLAAQLRDGAPAGGPAHPDGHDGPLSLSKAFAAAADSHMSGGGNPAQVLDAVSGEAPALVDAVGIEFWDWSLLALRMLCHHDGDNDTALAETAAAAATAALAPTLLAAAAAAPSPAPVFKEGAVCKDCQPPSLSVFEMAAARKKAKEAAAEAPGAIRVSVTGAALLDRLFELCPAREVLMALCGGQDWGVLAVFPWTAVVRSALEAICSVTRPKRRAGLLGDVLAKILESLLPIGSAVAMESDRLDEYGGPPMDPAAVAAVAERRADLLARLGALASALAVVVPAVMASAAGVSDDGAVGQSGRALRSVCTTALQYLLHFPPVLIDAAARPRRNSNRGPQHAPGATAPPRSPAPAPAPIDHAAASKAAVVVQSFAGLLTALGGTAVAAFEDWVPVLGVADSDEQQWEIPADGLAYYLCVVLQAPVDDHGSAASSLPPGCSSVAGPSPASPDVIFAAVRPFLATLVQSASISAVHHGCAAIRCLAGRARDRAPGGAGGWPYSDIEPESPLNWLVIQSMVRCPSPGFRQVMAETLHAYIQAHVAVARYQHYQDILAGCPFGNVHYLIILWIKDEVAAECTPARSGGGDNAAIAPAALHDGARVQIHGLQAKPELNGRSGTATAWNAEKGRWAVELEPAGEGKPVLVKPANLVPAASQPVFAGMSLMRLVAAIMTLPDKLKKAAGPGSAGPVDVMENADKILAALNLFRFLLLYGGKDAEAAVRRNETGVWQHQFLDEVERQYLGPLGEFLARQPATAPATQDDGGVEPVAETAMRAQMQVGMIQMQLSWALEVLERGKTELC